MRHRYGFLRWGLLPAERYRLQHLLKHWIPLGLFAAGGGCGNLQDQPRSGFELVKQRNLGLLHGAAFGKPLDAKLESQLPVNRDFPVGEHAKTG